jgi:hypothetical protein
MGGINNDGAGVSLAVRLARDARALLDELRSAVQRDSTADAVRALRTLFDLSEDQVERLSRDMTAQQIGALRYVRQLLAHRCDELVLQDGAGQSAEGGHA